MRRQRLKIYLAVAFVCIAIPGVFCAYLACQPDRTLVFEREVPTQLPLTTITQSIDSVTNWHEWFFNAGKVERVDALGRVLPLTDQTAKKGALIQLEILPHKGEHRGGFNILIEITEYVPGKLLRAEILKDQSGRIQKLFDRVEWKIELAPGVIHGTETAHTRHWRSRLFGQLSPRILLNQVFYPDLMGLGQFTQPRSPNPYPAYGQ